jgi:RNA recognition motif-containing protein
MILFVGNLDHNATNKTLLPLFSPFATVKHLQVMTDMITGRSRGCAFVQIEEKTEAEHAIINLHNTKFMQKIIVVCEASHKHPLRKSFTAVGKENVIVKR